MYWRFMYELTKMALRFVHGEAEDRLRVAFVRLLLLPWAALELPPDRARDVPGRSAFLTVSSCSGPRRLVTSRVGAGLYEATQSRFCQRIAVGDGGGRVCGAVNGESGTIW